MGVGSRDELPNGNIHRRGFNCGTVGVDQPVPPLDSLRGCSPGEAWLSGLSETTTGAVGGGVKTIGETGVAGPDRDRRRDMLTPSGDPDLGEVGLDF